MSDSLEVRIESLDDLEPGETADREELRRELIHRNATGRRRAEG